MPNTIVCMDLKLKQAIIAAINKMELEGTAYTQFLKALPDCDGEEPIGFEEVGKKAKRKSTRAPSAYQQHTSECMKGGVKSMSECAAEWRAKKGEGYARTDT